MENLLFLIIICILIRLKANNINNDSILINENPNNNSFFENNFSINNNSPIKKKNLILGVIEYYSWGTIYPFFVSLQKAGFNNCDCVMFVDRIGQETINKLKSFDVKVIQIESSIYTKIINYRFKLYEDYLRNNLDKYNLVLTIDVRDSCF